MKPKAKTIIERHGFTDPDRQNSKHDSIQIWAYKNIKSIVKEVFVDKSIPEDVSFNIELEYAILDKNYVIGFVDIYCKRHNIGIEIKAEIPSVGDLIRQIHFYKAYLCTATWIVISPDDRFASVLKDQGILLYKYRNPGELF